MRTVLLTAVLLTANLEARGWRSTAAFELRVNVYDYASVPAQTLASAEAKASQMFHPGHIHLIWVERFPTAAVTTEWPAASSQPRRLNAVLKILPESRAADLHPAPRELGITIPGTSFVFFDRVRRASPVLPVSDVLGYVISHELGHLLGLHHSVGVMSESLPRAWLLTGGGMFGFTGEQLSEMEGKLTVAP